MTTTDRNDLMPAQEKLEWVTPKISLMGAGETNSKINGCAEGSKQIGLNGQGQPNCFDGFGNAFGPS
jgi:hypothetical protein